MQNNSVKLIYALIKKTIGKGSHKLHEPLFSSTEIKYTNETIKKILFLAQENMERNLKMQ